LATVIALAMCGCGNAPEEASAEEANAEFVDQMGEALSNREQCGRPATVDKLYPTSFPQADFVSGSSYDHPDCRHAFIVEITALQRIGDHNIVKHNETPPTTKSECEKLRLGAYIWSPSRVGIPAVETVPWFIDSTWRWGSWAGGRCTVPSIDLTELGLFVEGVWYRVAVSARRQFAPLDSGTDFDIRPLRLYRGI
jgi:hypothetical protein